MTITEIIAYATLVFSGLSLCILIYHRYIDNKETDEKARKATLQILKDIKFFLDNPPINGFDYTPTSIFDKLDQLDEYLLKKGIFGEEIFILLKKSRESIFQVKKIIDEVQSMDSALKTNVEFRQRFPKIKQDCINIIEECITKASS